MSATATELATARPSNLRVRVRVAALKLLLCSVRAANTFVAQCTRYPNICLLFWIAIHKLLLANVR